MKNHFFYSTILMSLFLISCSSKLEVDVSVTNHAGEVIDSIQVQASGINQSFTKPLLLGRDTAFVIDFSNVPKVDGELRFWFYVHGGKKIYYADYYSNGLPLTNNYDIEVLDAPIKVKSKRGLLW